jgi:hypothetical protein
MLAIVRRSSFGTKKVTGPEAAYRGTKPSVIRNSLKQKNPGIPGLSGMKAIFRFAVRLSNIYSDAGKDVAAGG